MPLETDPEIRPQFDQHRYIGYVQEKFGVIGFTKSEMTYLIAKANGKHRGNYHARSVIAKIRKYTGWNMNAGSLVCRFAYKHGIVEL